MHLRSCIICHIWKVWAHIMHTKPVSLTGVTIIILVHEKRCA